MLCRAYGKTTFMLQVADNMAKLENTKILLFSLEMPLYSLIAKNISRISYLYEDMPNLDYNQVLSQNDEENLLSELLNRYTEIASNIYMIDDIYELVQIMEYIKDFKRENENSNIVVIIDYIQWVKTGFPDEKKSTDIILKNLKALTKELDVAIVTISSLNRSSYDMPIAMNSFKESGGIEYIADTLLGLEYTNNNPNDRETEQRREKREVSLVCLKNKYGEQNKKIKFKFFSKYNYFEEE